MERAPDFIPEQKRMFYRMLLTSLVAAAVANSLHNPRLLFLMLFLSWTISILTFEQQGYVRITLGVLVMGVLCYLMYGFVFPAA